MQTVFFIVMSVIFILLIIAFKPRNVLKNSLFGLIFLVLVNLFSIFTNIGLGFGSVSYTHLDVYKRQPFTAVVISNDFISFSPPMYVHSEAVVSYPGLLSHVIVDLFQL